MSTKLSDADWAAAPEVFRASLPARDDRMLLEALHYFTVHNIFWRGLTERFGKWNSEPSRFSRRLFCLSHATISGSSI